MDLEALDENTSFDVEEPMYLMSIKPQYARAIFSGRKKYELRRLKGLPVIEPGSIIIVYVSGRVKSIVGEFRAARVIEGRPEKVWSVAGKPDAGVGEDAWSYIRGSSRAMAIEVGERAMYARPVTLEEIRRIIPGWNPPFSFRRLEEGDPLLELILRRVRSTRHVIA